MEGGEGRRGATRKIAIFRLKPDLTEASRRGKG